jgi:hypothetical protein
LIFELYYNILILYYHNIILPFYQYKIMIFILILVIHERAKKSSQTTEANLAPPPLRAAQLEGLHISKKQSAI